MRRGFFNLSELSTAQNPPTAPRCGLCGLYRTCHSPKMKPTGEGRKGILVVTGDDKEIRLTDESHECLKNLCRASGASLFKDCWKTDAIICATRNNKLPKNPKPVIDACRPNLINTIKKFQPHTIILLGKTAVSSLIPYVWKDKGANEFGKWPGQDIPCQKLNAWIICAYHPAFLLRQKNELLETLTRKHLKQAFKHTKRPWDIVPDYAKEVELIHRPSQAAKAIRDIVRIGKPASWDIETTSLKPEEKGAEIVCCSVCQNGNRTISFPWAGEVVEAMVEFLQSPLGKVGANLKFEERFTRFFLGFPVKNWMWDDVVCAHVIDNRSGVTGVKFSSFTLLGMESYNDQIEAYLKPAKGRRINRIKELPINDLLLYCGLDSLVEWKIYEVQRKKMERLAESMKRQKQNG